MCAVDLGAPFALVSAFVPGMSQRRWGRVVNVSACLGRMSGPGTAGGLAPYRVAKAGLNASHRPPPRCQPINEANRRDPESPCLPAPSFAESDGVGRVQGFTVQL